MTVSNAKRSLIFLVAVSAVVWLSNFSHVGQYDAHRPSPPSRPTTNRTIVSVQSITSDLHNKGNQSQPAARSSNSSVVFSSLSIVRPHTRRRRNTTDSTKRKVAIYSVYASEPKDDELPRKQNTNSSKKNRTGLLYQFPEFWLRSNIPLCGVKYGPDVVDMLRQQIQVVRGVKRVAIVAILSGVAHILDHWVAAVLQVIDILHPRNVFVSIVESNSKDESSGMLLALKVRLSQLGVPFVVSVNNSRLANTLREDRIDFLARMRNLALQPVVDLTMHANHSFDRVVFLNDVVLCGGDILRLLAHDADMACGADFEQDGFYDHWVMEWEPGYVMDWSTARYPEPPRANLEPSHDYTVPVFACWNGAVAFRGDVIRYGVRFRRSMLELGDAVDCAQSECSLFALDLHRLGFHRIVLDASVHVAYSVELFTMWARDTHPQVKYHVVTPQRNATSRTDWRCCPLDRGELFVQGKKCQLTPIYLPPCDRDFNATACLMYHPQRWEVEWDWPQIAVGLPSTLIEATPSYDGPEMVHVVSQGDSVPSDVVVMRISRDKNAVAAPTRAGHSVFFRFVVNEDGSKVPLDRR